MSDANVKSGQGKPGKDSPPHTMSNPFEYDNGITGIIPPAFGTGGNPGPSVPPFQQNPFAMSYDFMMKTAKICVKMGKINERYRRCLENFPSIKDTELDKIAKSYKEIIAECLPFDSDDEK